MFEILKKIKLHRTATLIKVKAPLVVKNAKPGQFVVLRVFDSSERIPLTIFDCDKKTGVLVLIFQVVGATTVALNALNEGDKICDILGPLGKPSELSGCSRACVVGGGVGCANIFSIAKGLKQNGAEVVVVVGFKNESLAVLKHDFEQEFMPNFFLTTDDGSCGEKGLVTDKLKNMFISGETFDLVFVAGPLPMMKAVCELTKKNQNKNHSFNEHNND